MNILELARKSHKAPAGAVYRWILECDRNTELARNLLAAGWAWWTEHETHLTTMDPGLAAATANSLGLDIVTTGSHRRFGVPVLLCDPLA
jgi:hypothetical protein